ncbi:MAG TPA: arylsulfotransferase family protein, partial [Catenuloplanes sp.]
LAGGGAAAAALAGVGGGYALAGADDAPPVAQPPPGPPPRYRSRPDLRALPEVTVTHPARGAQPGYVFLTPASGAGLWGPLIVDDTGSPVWFRKVSDPATVAIDLKVQRYRGQPVLTWWEGTIGGTGGQGVGQGEFVIVDASYREVARVRASGAEQADQHDFVITPNNTALFLVYELVPVDLSALGGPANGVLHDGVIQEIDIATGRKVFEWRARDHITTAESYSPLPQGDKINMPFDYLHPNSVGLDADGNLLMSARHTWACYKIHRRTGAVLWRLGGKRSDFAIGERAAFSWQHDIRRRRDGTYGLFDNVAGIPALATTGSQSRGLVLRLDEAARTATFVREFLHPNKLLGPSQGGLQELDDGGSFVGWGQQPHFSEHAPDGTLRFAGHLPLDNQSYRGYRFEWVGKPADQPALTLRVEGGNVIVHVSWNGATGVSRWRVRAGNQPTTPLPVVAEAARTGFETVLTVPGRPVYVVAEALDGTGTVLGSSATLPVQV